MEVTLEQLRFEREGRRILDVPRLRFPANTTTAVFGPNGAGKTTLLRLLAGLEEPTSGRVISGARPAFAFQEAVFVRGSVRYNLELALRLREVPAGERGGRIDEVARECGIAEVLERPARALSAGEAQRVNLARTLALRAPVTLLDEPLAGIDRVTRDHLLDDLPRLLATFAATTVLVTHDREEAFRLADHLVILSRGRVRMAGPKRAVYEAPADAECAALLGYTVLPTQGGPIAVPPGGWKLATGAISFRLTAAAVVDMGRHWHVIGTAGGVRVDVRLPPDAMLPQPGTTLDITPATFVALAPALENPVLPV